MNLNANDKNILKDLNLSNDFIFAKVMSDPKICKEFLEKLLEIEILYVDIIDSQKVIDPSYSSKGVRLDIYLNDENKTVYNIEMQTGDNKELLKRIRYYQSSIDFDMLAKGTKYKELKKSYIIFICTFDYFKKGRHKYSIIKKCKEDNSLEINDGTNAIILNSTGVIKDMSEEMIEFLEYVDHSNEEVANKSQGELVKHIHEKLKNVKNDTRMVVEYMTLLERYEEKFEEGELSKSIKVALEMIDDNAPIEKIIKYTGLNEEKILELKNPKQKD